MRPLLQARGAQAPALPGGAPPPPRPPAAPRTRASLPGCVPRSRLCGRRARARASARRRAGSKVSPQDGGGGDLPEAPGPGRRGDARPARGRQVLRGADLADRGEGHAHRPGMTTAAQTAPSPRGAQAGGAPVRPPGPAAGRPGARGPVASSAAPGSRGPRSSPAGGRRPRYPWCSLCCGGPLGPRVLDPQGWVPRG